ncbi:hypothetical protein DV517_41230 [Streptomyces sp. S816]|nr:hypothetical protein DV517_41230 [Streptomyces sp. S816]
MGEGVRHAEEVMGTVFSFDVRGGEAGAVRAALGEVVARLHEVDAVFSTYRADSAVSRLARGELTVERCPAEVARVLGLAAEAERISEGWFSARYRGVPDPTGIVKGWAAERAARRLAEVAGVRGVGVNGGGDVQSLGAPEPGGPGGWGSRTPCGRAG